MANVFSRGGGDLLGRTCQLQAIQQFLIGQHGAVIKCEMRVVAVAEGNVRQFRRQRGCEAGLVGQHVQQSAADHDRLAHGKRFERRGEQHPAFRLDSQVIAGNEVVDHGIQYIVYTAGHGEQTGFLQAFDDIRLRLALPGTLAFERCGFRGRARSLMSFSVSMAMEVSSSSRPFFGML